MTVIGGVKSAEAGSKPARAHWRHRLTERTWARRHGLQAILDCAAWAAALSGAWALVGTDDVRAADLVPVLLLAGIVQIVVGRLLRLYGRRYLFGSFGELGAAATSVLLTGLVVAAPLWQTPALVLLAALGALTLMGGSRYVIRLAHDSARRPVTGERVLVVGAGDAGLSLARQMLADQADGLHPVGFVDDDPQKRFLRLEGLRVLGGTDELGPIAQRMRVSGVIVAIAQSDAAFLRACRDSLSGTGVWLRTIPSVSELVSRPVELGDVRRLRVEDLIGRSPLHTDLTEIRKAIVGRRVLVTGAGGSIGSELCRQLHALDPSALIMLDRDETALHGVELSIRGSALLTSPDTVLADIRDRDALRRVFTRARPDIVFHAAALKHLPMLQRFPLEGWKTNVHGTLNVLEAAHAAGATGFVNISTDKAAAPTSQLGRSKRLGERLVAEYARRFPGTYLSVRFGNVLGSRGSVLDSFREQLRAGGPLTVTDPDVTRYFMTIPEACQLVLQAAVIGENGHVMVLDMGEPVRIVDLAKNLIALADADSEIVFTGLRPGEKLDEELFGDYESDDVQVHDQISRVRVPALEIEDVPPPDALPQTVEDFVDEACAFRTEEIPVVAPAGAVPASESAVVAVAEAVVPIPGAVAAPVLEADPVLEAVPVPATAPLPGVVPVSGAAPVMGAVPVLDRARAEVQQHAG